MKVFVKLLMVATFGLAAYSSLVEAGDGSDGMGSIIGTATWQTRGVFGLGVKTKTCSGHPVWATPAESWADARERVEATCRHDGSFRIDGLTVGRTYHVEALVRWKTPNFGIVQGGRLEMRVHVPSSVPVNIEIRGEEQ